MTGTAAHPHTSATRRPRRPDRADRRGDPGGTVAVVGAGIGGLAAAVALLRRGVDVTVYEQAPGLREVGVGMHLGPNGARVLRDWGLLPALHGAAVRPEAMEVRAGTDGKLLARQPMGDAWQEAYGAPHLTVERTALHTALASRIPADRLRLGARLRSFTAGPDGVRLYFGDGHTASAGLLVGADGVHSVVRRAVAGEETPVRTGTCALRGTVPARRLPRLAPDTLYIWSGGDRRLLCYPVAGGRRFTFVAVLPESARAAEPRPAGAGESWSAATGCDRLRQAFAAWCPQARAVLDAARTAGRWSLYDREPLATWGTGRTTLLGDAAHPMLPHHGQGCGQALEDAVALAHFLDGTPGGLRRYEEFRRPHVTRVQLGARDGGSQRFSAGAPPAEKPETAARPAPHGPGATGAGAGVGRLVDDMAWVHGYDVAEALRAAPSPPVATGPARAERV